MVCRTPKFEEYDGEKHPSVQLPCDCFLSVTMDGINYSECEQPFKIYSNDINLTSIYPKCGSITGGTVITMNTNIDQETADHLHYFFQIGFRPKKRGQGSRLNNDNRVGASKNSLEDQ